MKSLVENGEIFVASNITLIPDELLRDRKGNSKKHPADQLARLAGGIREFGFVVPLLIDGNNEIIAGHGRRLAGRAVGMSEFPCVLAEHLSQEQVRALVIFDNKIAETGFDLALLKVELDELRDLDAELLGLTGFTDAELAKLASDLEGGSEDDKDPSAKPPEIRFGDHKLPLSLAESSALDALVEMHLAKYGDAIGFVEKTLLKGYSQ